MQQLVGSSADLERRLCQLYKLLKKADKFTWTDEADVALKQLKEILSSAPILVAPEPGEPLLIYMAATNRVISIVVVVDRKEPGYEHGVERPV